jgi:hypothetical protein
MIGHVIRKIIHASIIQLQLETAHLGSMGSRVRVPLVLKEEVVGERVVGGAGVNCLGGVVMA